MKSLITSLAAASLVLSAMQTEAAADPGAAQPIRMPQLQAAASMVRDTNHIAHVEARNEHDVYFLQGWVHAQDRLFQMDYERRVASGTVAELFGPQALESDVTLRTLGLRRAAQQSLPAVSADTRSALQAYADGVNAWAAAHPLPPEYGALELTRFAPWTPADSLVIGKLIAFSLAFELDVDATVRYLSYVQAGAALGFDGDKLYHEDLVRSAPFDPASTIPDASRQTPSVREAPEPRAAGADASWIHPKSRELAEAYLERARRVPQLKAILDRSHRASSNLWAVSGALTDTGRPLIANDPHLDLFAPSQFYPIGLEVAGGLTVSGESFAGLPGVILGYNRNISWGATTLQIDVTDTYQEQVIAYAASPSGLATLYKGQPEPVIPIPETFRVNQLGSGVLDNVVVVPPGGAIPAFTLIVPRRNNGPIISFDPATGIALSVQYTGSGATRELDAFLKLDHASNLAEFLDALQFIDVGAQNFVYADNEGNVAYAGSGELPIREDLQANMVNGSPPWFIRNGQGGNEWLPVQHPQPHQALAFEILPFSEMPQIVNPPAEFFVNGNNDPVGVTLGNNPLSRQRAGGGIDYLAYSFNPGFRAGRITERIDEYLSSGDRHLSFAKMQSIQADVKLRDAQVFVPYLLGAFTHATRAAAPGMLAALAANARLAEAVQRLSKWSLATPTGIPEGFDASQTRSPGAPPTQAQIDDSVCATIYAVWRGQFVKRAIDAHLAPFGLPVPDDFSALVALRNLLDNFARNHGVGASGVNFFNVPGLTVPEDARDFVLLDSLARALDLLASDAFGPAFHKSTTLADYRWGKLHRIVLAHPLGAPFSIPPAGGAFPDPLAGLPGIPVDGGFQTVDVASHSVRAASVNEFMFNHGPARRFVSERSEEELRSESIWPGGTSGVLGSPWYFTFLPLWLTNQAIPLLLNHEEVRSQVAEVVRFVPAP